MIKYFCVTTYPFYVFLDNICVHFRELLKVTLFILNLLQSTFEWYYPTSPVKRLTTVNSHFSLCAIIVIYFTSTCIINSTLHCYCNCATAAKSLQSCPTLCDPIDCSPPSSAVPGILQARTLEWVAISFSNAWKCKVKVKSLGRVWLLTTPWAAAYQAPPSVGFSRQEY